MRNIAIDISKGIAILAMIVGHSNFPYMPFIDSFHMPLFFILSGYFYSQKSIKESMRKDFYRLIVPYIIFATIFILKFSFTKGILLGDWHIVRECTINAIWAGGPPRESEILFSSMKAIGAIWFLPALFWCKNIYNAIITLNLSIKWRFLIILLISLFAIYLFNNVINLPFGILTGCSGMIFYVVGHIVKASYVRTRYSAFYQLLLILSWISAFSFSDLTMVECRYDCFPLNFIGACGGTLAIYMLSKFIESKSKILSKVLSWCGRYSLLILCFHFLNTVIDIGAKLQISNWILLLAANMIIIVPEIYVCTRFALTRRIFQIKR